MQTFLPYEDFAQSAAVLDRQRLGKQRVEGYQLIRALLQGTESPAPWSNHPAARMWRGHGMALLAYTIAVCDEWTSRGYKDTVRQKAIDQVAEVMGMSPDGVEANARQDLLAHPELGAMYGGLPEWLGNRALHLSHQSNLLRKAPEHYGQFGWTVTPDLPYVWPVDAPTPPSAAPKPQASEPADTQHKEDTHVSDEPVAESSSANLNREQVVEALRAAGWEGPTSYSKGRLVEMLDTLKAGGSIEVPRRGRKPKESDVGEAEAAQAAEA